MGTNPASLGAQMPAGADFFTRKLRDIERAATEQAAARSLEASSIGAGGLTVQGGSIQITAGGSLLVDGDATFNGNLTVPAGSLNSGGNLTAGVDISAGRDVIAQGAVKATGAVTGASFSATGTANVGGKLTVGGELNVIDVYNTVLPTHYKIVYVDDTGHLGNVPSSKRFKQDIVPCTFDTSAVYRAETVNFRYVAAVEQFGNSAVIEVGGIAEQFEACGLHDFVVRDEAGAPFGIAYERLSIALIPVVQEQHAQILKLTGRLDDVEARLTKAGV